MDLLKELTKATVQIMILISLYPVFFMLGLYARTTRRDSFCCVAKICGMTLFPAFGKWYLPMIWI